MKFCRLFVLLGTAFLVGCGGEAGGKVGDQNDPATSGTDDAQMNEKDGAVQVLPAEK